MNIEKIKIRHTFFIKSLSHVGYNSLSFSSQKLLYQKKKTSHFVLGFRKNRNIIDIKKTQKYILQALFLLALNFKSEGHLLVINTNNTFSKIFKHFIKNEKKILKKKILFSHSNDKWLGGGLTNWKQISKSIKIFSKFYKDFNDFVTNNSINFPQYKKMKKSFRGFFTLNDNSIDIAFKKKPDLILLVNPNDHKNIIQEASRLNIPIIAFTNTSSDLSSITLPLTCNNNSINLVYFCLNWICKYGILSRLV